VSSPRLLVIENDPSDDARRLGEWLAGAGLELVAVRPYTGDPVPASLADHAGLLVMGGAQDAFDAPDGTPGALWFPALKGLLREAVAGRTPTLAVCLGAQLLAEALGGRVGRSPAGLHVGPLLVARRDAADRDPLFAGVPFTPDVYQWHRDQVTVLPPGAVPLAASSQVPHQAFRVGDRAWGLQFHLECDLDMLATWADHDAALLAELGLDAETVLARCADALDDVAEAWRPFAERFAALVRGVQGGMPLPVVPT